MLSSLQAEAGVKPALVLAPDLVYELVALFGFVEETGLLWALGRSLQLAAVMALLAGAHHSQTQDGPD